LVVPRNHHEQRTGPCHALQRVSQYGAKPGRGHNLWYLHQRFSIGSSPTSMIRSVRTACAWGWVCLPWYFKSGKEEETLIRVDWMPGNPLPGCEWKRFRTGQPQTRSCSVLETSLCLQTCHLRKTGHRKPAGCDARCASGRRRWLWSAK
jgi:hypothetical protein